MANRVRILRGDTWAARLAEQLAQSSSGAAEWMQAHAQILNSSEDSISALYRLDEQPCFLKLYRFKSLRHRLSMAFGTASPLRNFRVARDLGAEGLAVPRPLGCLRVSRGILMLVEGIMEGGNLADQWRRQPADDEARRMMRSAGETLATLHRFGYAHRKCKWEKLFWDGHRVHLIDLNKARKCAPGAAAQARDLAQFTVGAEKLKISSSMYGLFLETYLHGMDKSRREVVQGMLPFLYEIRTKHLVRYGPHGQRLV